VQIDSTGTSGSTATKVGLDTVSHAGGTSTSVATIRVDAMSPGAHGNGVSVACAPATNDPAAKFAMSVISKGSVVEPFDELSMDPTSDRYFVSIINKASKYIVVTDLLEVTVAAPGNRPATATTALANGVDAVATMVDADILGDSAARTGFYASDLVSDAEILSCPGWTSLAVQNAGIAYCEARKDMYFVGAVPAGVDVNGAKDFRNAAGAYSSGAKPNSSYGALYFGWINVIDTLTSLKKAVPPDGDVIARTINCLHPWLAPAGSTRAKVQNIDSLAYPLSKAQVGNLYDVAVNSLWNNPATGPVIYGQKTLQVSPSATDRVNVRRLLLFLEGSLGPSLEPMAFEPNDASTWSRIERSVNRFMDKVMGDGGVYDYRFFCNDATTTAEDIDNNRLNADLFIKPKKAAEFIKVRIIVTDTGVSFQQLAA
jgi:phage tail sheath protein FI